MILVLILTALLVCSTYISANLYYKNLFYEQQLTRSQTQYDIAYGLLNKMMELFVQAKDRLHRIDLKGSFSTDDEVGFVFKLINSTIIEVSSKLEELKEILNEGEQTKKID